METVVFNGLAVGMLFFLISVGLSITLGLMNFVNLAHGVFAMAGAYTSVLLIENWKVPFLLSVLAAAVVGGVISYAVERTIFRRLYGASELSQVLCTIAIVFVAVGAARFLFGDNEEPFQLPAWLSGEVRIWHLTAGKYRVFLIAAGAATALALHMGVVETKLGARLRAAVDDQRVAVGIGINVDRLFSSTFALGGALAGLGGALGTQMLGVDPSLPLKFLVLFLIVVSMGGAGSIAGPLAAALILGILDTAGKFYVPQAGAFIIYVVMVLSLVLRPNGLFHRTM